ncbi:putative DNA polymerase III, delta subunit [unidentified eubacterium SCB49]|nr:putative DNA polymerase III, delta subunit [unidentified eubacterium SCB49]
MDFNQIIGQEHIKAHLQTSVTNGRVAHAQLFVGKVGVGILPMAIAYASALLCKPYEEGSPEYLMTKERVRKLAHPDLNFVFPVNTNDKIRKHPVSDLFIEEWRNFVSENPYGSQFEWLSSLGIEKKQGSIKVDEALEIVKKMSLKSYEGGYKIIIIWMADTMNTDCANKILKLVEEPPKNTVLLLLTEKEEQIINTIRSRCQKLDFPLLSELQIAKQLIEIEGVETIKAQNVSRLAQGDYNKALQLLDDESDDALFEQWFLTWVRNAFLAKGNKKAIQALLKWSENLAGEGRETQKKFLSYCIEFFRQALLKNYGAESLVFFKSHDVKFDLNKFAPFVHQNNIFEITEQLQDASYHIERNGNAKIIFADLSIKLTRLIHRKS